MGKFKKEDLKIGDYIYYKNPDGEYKVTKIMSITDGDENNATIHGYWNEILLKELPKTVEALEIIVKTGTKAFIKVKNVTGVVNLNNDGVSGFNSIKLSEKLLSIDDYESSTIITLNEMLKDGYDLDDFLKILIPNIIKKIKQ